MSNQNHFIDLLRHCAMQAVSESPEWKLAFPHDSCLAIVDCNGRDVAIAQQWSSHNTNFKQTDRTAIAEYIAAANPAVVLELFARLDKFEAQLAAYSTRKMQKPFIKLRVKQGHAAEAKLNNVIPVRGKRVAIEHDPLTRRIKIYQAESGFHVTQYGTFACPIELALAAGGDRVSLSRCDDGSWIGYYEAKSEQ